MALGVHGIHQSDEVFSGWAGQHGRIFAEAGGEGKEIWQVKQAEKSLRVFYQEVEPTGWAKNWPVDLKRNLGMGRSLDSFSYAFEANGSGAEVSGIALLVG